MGEYLPLLVLWVATAALPCAAAAAVIVRRRLRVLDKATANVIQLPPRAARSGPTHVVRRVPPVPVLFDDELEHA